MQPLLKILLDTKRIKQKTGKYPVKMMVTFGNEQKQYPIDIDLSTEEFNLVEKPGDIEKGVSATNKRKLKKWIGKLDQKIVFTRRHSFSQLCCP